MVSWAGRLTSAAAAAALLLGGLAVPAAHASTPGGTTVSRNPAPLPVGGDTGGSGSGSGSGSAANGACHVFANSSHYGVTCGTVTTDPLSNIITTDELPWCWDEAIPPDQLGAYGYAPVDGSVFYIHACLAGTIDLSKSARNQPGMQINKRLLLIPISGGVCPTPYVAVQVGNCRMVLTTVQQNFVTAVSVGSIPSIVVTTHPSTTVRTNAVTGFADVAFSTTGNRIVRDTDPINDGLVTMHAHLVRFVIYPYGVAADGTTTGCPAYQPRQPGDPTPPTTPGTCEACDGWAAVSATNTPDNAAADCWWAYPASSETQQGTKHAYPFRAEADWQVFYNDGGGDTLLTTVQKFDDLDLPVLDVQSLNYG